MAIRATYVRCFTGCFRRTGMGLHEAVRHGNKSAVVLRVLSLL